MDKQLGSVKRYCLICKKVFFVYPYRVKNGKFCSYSHYIEFRRKNSKGRLELSPNERRDFLNKFDNKCGYCKKESSQPLQIHHIDWSENNNKEKNLVPLCISCHRRMQKRYSKSKNHISDNMLKNILETKDY